MQQNYLKRNTREGTTDLGKVIHWELCKKLKFYHSKKKNGVCTKQKLSVKMKLVKLSEFEIPIDHQISVKRPELILINKKNM